MLAFKHIPQLAQVNQMCDNSHPHLPWGPDASLGSFTAASELSYPRKLCQAVSTAVRECLQSRGIACMPASLSEVPATAEVREVMSRAAVGSSSAQRKLPELMPEYRRVLQLEMPASQVPCKVREWTTKFLRIGDVLLPPHTRVLADDPSTEGRSDLRKVTVGIPWKPQEFVAEAARRGHPKELLSSLPPELHETILFLASSRDHEIIETRSAFFRKWLTKASELHSEETSLKESLDQDFRKVVASKKILLFEKMVSEYELPDRECPSILKEGVDLAGKVPVSNDLPKHFTPPSMHVDDLDALIPVLREAAISRAEGAASYVKETWDKTLIEVEKGWLKGPFDPDSAEGSGVLSNRFGVCQKDKIRCVDDMSASLINATTFAEEKITLHSVDVICAAISAWYCARAEAGRSTELRAKSFDLKSAYKQLAVSVSSRKHANLVLRSPAGGAKVFTSIALPFGATQSVFSFNRVSRAIWALGTRGVRLMWTCFYDDFPIFASKDLEANTDTSAMTFFTLLGWIFDKDGDKRTEFGSVLHALGVSVRLSCLRRGSIEVLNTESRISELLGDLRDVLSKGTISRSHASHLAGRMSFAGGQIFGRLARSCLKVFHAKTHSRSGKLDEEAIAAIEAYCMLLLNAPAKKVTCSRCECFYLYTDASLEVKDGVPVAGLGGVLVSPEGEPLQFFSWFPDCETAAKLGIDLHTKCIFLLELLAVCIGFWMWSDVFRSSDLVCFTDNEAAKACLVKGSSAHEVANKLLFFQALKEAECDRIPWFSRVPSASNVADAPSRGDISDPLLEDAKEVCFNFDDFLRSYQRGYGWETSQFQ